VGTGRLIVAGQSASKALPTASSAMSAI